MPAPDFASAVNARLNEASAEIARQLAAAQARLAVFGVGPASPAPVPVPAEYRVFRHPQLGVHCVVRDRTEVLGHVWVLGPKHESGVPVTFAEALAFANRGFLAWAEKFLHGDLATMPGLAGVAAFEREANQLTVLYAEPRDGREA
jgi:hypothetical protein